MNHYYATINSDNLVVGVSDLAGPVDDPRMIPILEYALNLMGRRYNPVTGEFETQPPVPTVPDAVSSRQGKLALVSVGMYDAAETAIQAITDPIEKRKALIEWDAGMWEKSNPFLLTMWANLGGTPEQLDELFRVAITL